MGATRYPGIDVREGPRGTRYRARARRDGAVFTRTFSTLAAALAWRAEVQDGTVGAPPPVQVAQGSAVTRGARAAPAVVSVTDVAVQLCRGMVAGTVRTRTGGVYKPSVIRKYEATLRLDVVPRIGETLVNELRRGDLQRLVDEIAAAKSPEHARKALVALRVLMRLADRDGFIDGDPCRGVRAPSDAEPGRPARVLEPGEISAIVAAAEAEDVRLGRSLAGPLLALLAFTGLRLGEALGLAWGADGVDLQAGRVRVVRSVDRVRAGGVFPFVSPKTRSSRREVPIGPELVARLRVHRLRSRHSMDGDLVFTEDGTPLVPNGPPTRAFRRAVRDAGLAEPPPKLHDLRHAYASALLAAGLTVHAVAQLLGHSSPQLVMARYGHAYRSEVLSAGHRLEALVAAQGPTRVG